MSLSVRDWTKADQGPIARSKALAWIGIVLAAATLAGILAARFWRGRRAMGSRRRPQPPQPQAVLDLQGLTEEEAAARWLDGQDNAIHFNPLHSKREIVQANTLTIFNLSMVGLAVV